VERLEGAGRAGTAAPPRIRRVCDELAAAGCDALVALGSLHAAHLAGYDRYLSDLGGAVAVVVAADGTRTLVVGRREVAAAEEDGGADRVHGYGSADLLTLDPAPALAAACREVAGCARLAVAGPPALGRLVDDGADRVAFDAVLERARRVKDEDELARIADACALAHVAQRVVERGAAEGRTELELFGAARAAAEETAGRPVGWIATVAAGARASLVSPPFCVPGPEPIAEGAPVLCDIAVRHRGYWGDTTRTYGGDGDVAAVRDELAAVLDAMAAAARPGVPASEVFALARDAVAARVPGATMPHHGGHALGVEVAERPQILPHDPIPLEDGMVIALEPGAYVEGRFGVRVEDTYRVQPGGARRIDEVVA
jgi:Xaa-Pro dipeptidase